MVSPVQTAATLKELGTVGAVLPLEQQARPARGKKRK